MRVDICGGLVIAVTDDLHRDERVHPCLVEERGVGILGLVRFAVGSLVKHADALL